MLRMFKNKHVIIAMLVAPALAVLAWFAVDYFVAERPHAAKPGATYRLVAKSNCRYDSGQCDLENADFVLKLRPVRIGGDTVLLELSSGFALQSATLALVESGTELAPTQLSPGQSGGQTWTGEIPAPAASDAAIRVAVVAQNATWYAEVPVDWVVIPD
jgi:hypothetical protein